jgi:hypothetical protein
MDRYNMPVNRLPTILGNPADIGRISGEQWNVILLHSRKTQSLGQLASRLDSAGLLNESPPAVLRHLSLARTTAQRRADAARWEIDVIRRAINPSTPVILLKGCAYLVANDPNADGRLFSDIDILVPRASLGKAEAALTAAGWMPSTVNAYEQHYYRDWSHEVPPMEHVRRHTVVDLHHAIIPPISRYSIPTELLLERLEEIAPGIHVLGSADRVIHCAIHLIQEGEASKVFRDLYDLFLLLETHFPEGVKRNELYARAEILGLRRLVAAATNAAESVFRTDKPASRSPWLARLLIAAASASLPQTESAFSIHLSRVALLAQSHWMKMPMSILIPHLFRKTLLALVPNREPF